MKGKAARFEKVTLKEGETPQDHGGHGAPNTKETWVVRDADGANAATSWPLRPVERTGSPDSVRKWP